MAISIRLNPEEEKLIKSYAKLNGLSLSEVMRKAILEKIEDEYDLAVAEKALKEFKKDPVTYTHEEIGEMLGLNEDF